MNEGLSINARFGDFDCHLPRTLWLELMSCTVANVRSAWFADIASRPWRDCLCHDPWSLVDVELLFTYSLSLMVQLMATSLVNELLKHVSPCWMPSLRAAVPLSIGRPDREVAMIACLRRGFNCDDETSISPGDCPTEPIVLVFCILMHAAPRLLSCSDDNWKSFDFKALSSCYFMCCCISREFHRWRIYFILDLWLTLTLSPTLCRSHWIVYHLL